MRKMLVLVVVVMVATMLFAGVASAVIRSGGTGPDVLVGTQQNDRLFGGKGPDQLYGRAGDDLLNGGLGKDYCQGGKGQDTFRNCETKIQDF